MSKHITPAIGVILVETIAKDKTALTLGTENKGKIIKGRVLAVGDRMPMDGGLYWEKPCKEGDEIYFLHYEGGYDSCFIEGKEYLFAAFKDLRGVVSND